jgi:large subunit ribosomal protein L25
MAATKQLAATVRSGTGKGAARSVRREGRIPAVIYGGGQAAEPISLDYKTTNQLIYAGHFLTTIFELDVAGKKSRVIPRDYQLDVVKDTPLHVDFLRLTPGSRLRVEVPVHTINADQAPGIKKGGSINIVRHTILMTVPADNIPDGVDIDLKGLDINDSVHISAVTLPKDCKPVISRDFTVLTISPPTTYVEETPAAAADAAAPAAGAAPAAEGKAGDGKAAAPAAEGKAAAAPAKGAPAAAPAKGAPAKK